MTPKVQLPLLFTLIFTATCSVTPLYGQPDPVEAINQEIRQADVEMQIYFLAADEFRGRETGSPQLDIAARYIATVFQRYDVKPLPGQNHYYQEIPFIRSGAPHGGEIRVGDSTFLFTKDFIALNDQYGELSAPLAVTGRQVTDLDDRSGLEGKVVVTPAGSPGQNSPQQWIMNAGRKNRLLQELGAVAVVELYDHRQLPWELIANYMNRSRLRIDKASEEPREALPHFWLNTTGRNLQQVLREMESEEVTISVAGEPARHITSNNVVGYIEGANPELRGEYLLLGAHYDHIGTNREQEGQSQVNGQENSRENGQKAENGDGNSIYNGARDNAVGVSALLAAARYFSAHPPEGSIILAAWTGEEEGLLGSGYFAENPMVPLDRIVFHLNIDGAGYNDTSKVTVIGLERTGAEDEIRGAARAFGLEAIPDPVPEQNLFDRSDNVNFARAGIPSPTYSLGLTAFDEEIETYYHTEKDTPASLDYPYITRYIRSYILAAQRIANSDEAPFWREGDPYREAGLELYGLEAETQE